MSGVITSYSDRLEDVLLYRVLRHVSGGFYIDVGANHPEITSVTKLFYDLGWSGINIEPSRSWFDALASERPRDVNLCLAAGAENGTVELHDIVGTGLSTVVAEFAQRHEAAGFERRTYSVLVRTLRDICDEHVRSAIHFLKIDVEGAEAAVIAGSDWQRYRPWVVLVEANEPLTDIPSHAGWEPLLIDARYEFAMSDGLNRYYVASEHCDLLARFAVPVDDYVRAELAAIKASFGWRLERRAKRMFSTVLEALCVRGRCSK